VFHITDGRNPLSSNVGGIIFADIIENQSQVKSALEDGLSVLVMNNIVKDLDVNYLAVDNVKGGVLATEYLINLGHKRVGTVTGNVQTQSGADRLDGYQKALKKADIEPNPQYVFKGDYSRRSARTAAEQFFALDDPPTAIFAASDEMALEIISVAFEKGIRIPDDISIIGYDDNPAGLYGPIGLTTIKQPLFQMAEESVKILNEFMTHKRDEKDRVHKIFPPELIIRESCVGPTA
jgi:LacI family transcriptional regulator